MTGDVWVPESERPYNGDVWDYVDEVDSFEITFDACP